MHLIHLKNSEIDIALWDNCVENSVGGLPYAASWFLNIVSPNWEALVSSDYKYIMPITQKSKFGIKYIVQPALAQQLGIFSENQIPEDIVKRFVSKIPYLSYQINLNENNVFDHTTLCTNLTLSLNKSYNALAMEYTKNCLRNIKKAEKSELRVESVNDSAEMIEFLLQNTTEKKSRILAIFKQILLNGAVGGRTQNFGVRNSKGELIAAVSFLTTAKRWIYLLAASNSEGKSTSAMFALVDYVIRKNENTNILLDFEGSKIVDIARFYRGFGATNRAYCTIKRFRPHFLTRINSRFFFDLLRM